MNYCTNCDAIVMQSQHERREDSRRAILMSIADWQLLQYRCRWLEKWELVPIQPTRFSTGFSVSTDKIGCVNTQVLSNAGFKWRSLPLIITTARQVWGKLLISLLTTFDEAIYRSHGRIKSLLAHFEITMPGTRLPLIDICYKCSQQ